MGYPTTKLYPGELLQGAVGRAAANYGLDAVRFNKRVLGSGRGIIKIRSLISFSDIEHIWNRLWPVQDPGELLKNHTLVPMLGWRTLFIPHQVVTVGEEIKWTIWKPKGTASSFYKFCPECWEEQMRLYGERHWDTLCQVPGVNVCLKHRIALHTTTLRLDARNIPPERGYVTPKLVEKSFQMEIGPDAYLIANTALQLFKEFPIPAVTTTQWLRYITYLMGDEQPDWISILRLLQKRESRHLFKDCQKEIADSKRWTYLWSHLKDYRWWRWLKLLNIVSPDKKFVDALRECALLTNQKKVTD